MIKSTVYYVISTALSRGAFILYSPLLLFILSLNHFGLYNLVYILSMLLSPVLSFGGGSSILREGVTNKAKAYLLFVKYSALTSIVSVFLYVLISFFDYSEYFWLTYTLVLASSEAFILLALSYFRTINQPKVYLYVSICKLVSTLGVFLTAYKFELLIGEIFKLHSAVSLLFVLFLSIYIFVRHYDISRPHINQYQIFIFGALLIPHGLSQWVMSSSDRLFIKIILSNEELGIYSVGYLIASILMLINSGIGLALPQEMIKDYEGWLDKRHDVFWMKRYAFISITLLIAIELFFIVDKNFFHMIKYYQLDMYMVFSFAYLGITVLGVYYFFANYLFYFRRSKTISVQTFIAAVVNALLTIVFLLYIGIVGAAIATLVSYILYLYLVKKEAMKLEERLVSINSEINVIFFKLMIVLSLILFLSYLLWWLY